MKALKKYQEGLSEIYEYFGYVDPWEVFPIDDRTELYWELTKDTVVFGDTELEVSNVEYEGSFYYVREVDGKKNVYRGKDYTMIVVDTQTDGNVFLSIFDNGKEIK